MGRLKGRAGAKKKSEAVELRGLGISLEDMKARINAYRVFNEDSIEVVIRPGSDGIIREFVGPLIGRMSAGICIHQVQTKKKRLKKPSLKKPGPQVKAGKESA